MINNKIKTSTAQRSYITYIIFVCAFIACISCHRQAEHKNNTVYVFVCTGENAKRYHLKQNCSGLSQCSKEIIEITIEEAESKGRTPCRKCARD